MWKSSKKISQPEFLVVSGYTEVGLIPPIKLWWGTCGRAKPRKEGCKISEGKQTYELSKISTAQKYRKYRFWQKGGGYDRNIIKENTLTHAVRYIHNNPVRKDLVDEPGKWYYSSYNCWFNGVDEPIRIDKETWPLV